MKNILISLLIVQVFMLSSCDSSEDVTTIYNSNSIEIKEESSEELSLNQRLIWEEQMNKMTQEVLSSPVEDKVSNNNNRTINNLPSSGTLNGYEYNNIRVPSTNSNGKNTQWITFNFKGTNFFAEGGKEKHIAIGLMANNNTSSYLSGIGAILGHEHRKHRLKYSTAYYESYYKGGNHLDGDEAILDKEKFKEIKDNIVYSMIIHVNKYGWIWYRVINRSTGEVVVNNVRRYKHLYPSELNTQTGIFIITSTNSPSSYNNVRFTNINTGWF